MDPSVLESIDNVNTPTSECEIKDEKMSETGKSKDKSDDLNRASVVSIKTSSLLQTISELSDQPKNDPSASTIDQVNLGAEVIQYINEKIIPAWERWCKLCQMIEEQEKTRIEKNSRIYDFSNLVITRMSRSISAQSNSVEA